MSNNDVRNTFLKNNWMELPEIEKVVKYVDEGGNGFVDFRGFQKKIRTNMTNWDENWKAKERNIMQPSSEHIKKRVAESSELSKTFTNLRSLYKPDAFARMGKLQV